MPIKDRTLTLVEDMSFTIRTRVTLDAQDTNADHIGNDIRNIFSAFVAGASDTRERETYFREQMEAEIKAAHPTVLYAEVLVCSSDDPNNHQGATCPVHEGDGSFNICLFEHTQPTEVYRTPDSGPYKGQGLCKEHWEAASKAGDVAYEGEWPRCITCNRRDHRPGTVQGHLYTPDPHHGHRVSRKSGNRDFDYCHDCDQRIYHDIVEPG